MSDLYIGLMSGSSLDGVDAVLAAFGHDGRLQLLGDYATPYPDDVRHDILALQDVADNELDRAARLAGTLARLYADAVLGLLQTTGHRPAQIRAIGCHGQTVRHAPQAGYTLQLGNLALLAELTGICVAGDFRSRDVAAGGQGAPLVPAFHQGVFASPDEARVIVNVGGIANFTRLTPGQPVIGFDSGPGNMLMDAWIRQHHGQHYDADGAWAASGRADPALLATLLGEPYFAAPVPKSTGRDLFSLRWLQGRLAAHPGLPAADVQATLLELTAASIADAIQHYAPATRALYLCGGGAHNGALRRALGARLPGMNVDDTGALGLPVQHVEAAAFAWLAQQLLQRRPGNLPAATGAAGERVLGALYPR